MMTLAINIPITGQDIKHVQQRNHHYKQYIQHFIVNLKALCILNLILAYGLQFENFLHCPAQQ